MEFPDSLPVKQLECVNACYDATKIAIAEALYHGGKKFECLKNKLLFPRAIESQGGGGGQKIRQARLKSASYTPHVSGFIDFLAACVFQSQPCVLFKGDETRVEFYNRLNTALPSLLHSRLIELILHGSAYISLSFPESDMQYPDLEMQRNDGALDGAFSPLDYATIIDWERDEEGELVWLKTRSVDLIRNNPWEQPSVEAYSWTFISADGIYEYEASKVIGKDFDPKAMATLTNSHAADGLMVSEIALPTRFCLMDSVAPLAIALFNREASLDFALDSSAYSLPVIKTKKNISKIMGSELACLSLEPGDDFSWASPSGIVYDALKSNAEDKRKALENRIHSAALNLASRDTQGRASGIAKFRDFGPIAILLSMYGDCLRETTEDLVAKMVAIRGDEDAVEWEVMGLDEFDIQAIDAKMDLVSKFILLPAAPSAKQWALGDLSQSMAASAPPDVREKIKQESEESLPTAAASPSGEPTPQSGGDVPAVKDNLPQVPPGHEPIKIPYKARVAVAALKEAKK